MLNSWLRAANPFNAPRGMVEAQRAARVAVFGLLASSLAGLAVALVMSAHPEWMATILANQNARMGLNQEQIALQRQMMSSIMPTIMLIGSAVGVVLYAALAWAQWKYMTRAIPVIVIAFLLYSILTSGIAAATGQYVGLESSFWALTTLSWIVQAAAGVLYAASVRGAWVLNRLKQEP